MFCSHIVSISVLLLITVIVSKSDDMDEWCAQTQPPPRGYKLFNFREYVIICGKNGTKSCNTYWYVKDGESDIHRFTPNTTRAETDVGMY